MLGRDPVGVVVVVVGVVGFLTGTPGRGIPDLVDWVLMGLWVE